MFRLPFLFIVTGMIGFLLFHTASLISLTDWMNQGLRGPTGWFHTHLFILGWATMLAMGAVYQLIHVVLQSNIYSERLGYIHYAFFTIGLCGLLYGFLNGKILWIAGFAILTFVGILLFAWNMAVTLFRARQWNAITISAACAVMYLVLTGLFGMAMGLNFVTGIWTHFHESLFGAHIWMGTIGWFGMLILGFSYKMLPMFYLSHQYPIRLQKVTLIIWNLGVLTGAASFFFGEGFWGMWSALLLITIALATYNIHLLQIRKSRIKRNPGLGIKWSVHASQALLVIAVLMTLYTIWFPEQLLHSKSVMIAGWIYIGGWVSFTILCYASKIVPFLWWTHKYGKLAGKPGTRLMADLLDERKVNLSLFAIATCLMLLFVGLIFDAEAVIIVGGSAFSFISILYMLLLGRVFTR